MMMNRARSVSTKFDIKNYKTTLFCSFGSQQEKQTKNSKNNKKDFGR